MYCWISRFLLSAKWGFDFLDTLWFCHFFICPQSGVVTISSVHFSGYEDRMMGRISEENFSMLIARTQTEQEEVKAHISLIRQDQQRLTQTDFDYAQWREATALDIATVAGDLEAMLNEMDIGPLLGLWFQSSLMGIIAWVLSICIFIIVYGRMIEIYMVTSVAPIPMATMANREWGQMGQNYLRSLFALGFQAFLIMVCVGIYAVLVQGISLGGDISTALWTCIGYTVLLCFTLFKSGSVAKSVFNAH